MCFTRQADRREEDWENQSCLKPWMWPPWVRCYCPVGMNGDDRWAGRGWVGFGRRLSDSSRELEGVVGGLAGQRHTPSPVFSRAKASTKLWQKRVDGLNIWNVNSTKRNPEQMWNNYWSDNYRHVCHFTQYYVKVLQHSWYSISKVQVLWCVCVCACMRVCVPMSDNSLHSYVLDCIPT